MEHTPIDPPVIPPAKPVPSSSRPALQVWFGLLSFLVYWGLLVAFLTPHFDPGSAGMIEEFVVFVLQLVAAGALAFGTGRLLGRVFSRWITLRAINVGLLLLGLALAVTMVWGVREMLRSGPRKMAQGSLRQIGAALDQHSLENGDEVLFVSYDELIGPERYLGAAMPVEGQDVRKLFPVHVGPTEILWVTLPWGEVVEWEMGNPPVPHPDDGVHVFTDSRGIRFETTWSQGRRQGPFRAFRADGTLLGEAVYADNRITGDCWCYTPDGRKFNAFTEWSKVLAAARR